MTILFRAIKRDADGRPFISHTSAKGLGVRLGHDITPDDDGLVHPGLEGPSVGYGTSIGIPFFLRELPIWTLQSDDLPEYLTCRQDDGSKVHGFIEPAYSMEFEDFREAVAETRDLWSEGM